MRKNYAVTPLILGLLLLLVACNPQAPVTAPASPTPALPTAPVSTIAPIPYPSPVVTPSPTVTKTPTPVTPVAKPAPVPKTLEPAEVTITVNRTMPDFPNKLTFTVEGTSVKPVKTLALEYGTDKRSITSEVSRVEPEYGKESRINTSWTWEMKKTGSIPTTTRIWWQWRVIDDAGRTYLSPRQTTAWEDTRYQWRVENTPAIDYYWLNQDAALIRNLTAGLESRLSQVKLEVAVPKERKPRIVVYNNSEQIKGAVLFSQDWTGALAFPWYNIILTAVNASNLEWAKGTLAHEITHLLVGEAVFGPFGGVPTWLNEGLAQYSEGEMTARDRRILDDAIKQGTLLSVRSLIGGFPADSAQAFLAYAQSQSLVTYLIDTFGWEKMRELLRVYKDGSTHDNALKKVYGFDTSGLEREWRTKVGAS